MKTLDAENKKMGRLASEIARILQGKDAPDYARNTYPTHEVKVINVSKMAISATKLRTKDYTHHTQYPGGFRRRTLENVVTKKGYGEALRKAVYGMLPDNKLRAKMLKHLTLEE